MDEEDFELVLRPKSVKWFSLLHWVCAAIVLYSVLSPWNELVEYSIGNPGEIVVRDYTRPYETPLLMFLAMWLLNWVLIDRIALGGARWLACAALTVGAGYLVTGDFATPDGLWFAILVEIAAIVALFQPDADEWFAARSEGRAIY